ncbi:DGQHR domain-containing protein [Cronobacter turicensis]|nr:DGQHR domain-containing protein [Cronobacter turicensis]EKY1943856.1 DGQHR domain-containing protein [Cronobacter turicensis]EKY1992721.1 DGQHR domain-containing protein [Cronobacter turicensis]
MNKFPMKFPAIKIEQPLGDFYVVSIPAEILLKVCYTIRAEILDDFEGPSVSHVGTFINKLVGNQRITSKSRLDEIKRYTETVDASFPNSIILGVNYATDGTLVTDENVRWNIEHKDNGFYYLIIPTEEKLASIIDGQHRVFGFANSNRKDMELLCSVYLDLPLAYHGRIFTNININQRQVDKNLAYNLFQFDMEQGEPSSWSPETLAVYFARVLSEDKNSPLRGKIKLGVVNGTSSSTISMASIIDGILSLITSNPKTDRDILQTKKVSEGRDRNMLLNTPSKAPLRKLYLNNKDKTLFEIISEFLNSVVNNLWKYDVFKKTLGIQACFDFLKIICENEGYNHLDINRLVEKTSYINFDDPFFGVQSKLRVRIKNALIVASGMKVLSDLSIKNDADYLEYKRLLINI